MSAQEIPNRTETELPSSSFEEKGQGFVEIPVQVLTQKPQTSRHEEPDLAADLPEVRKRNNNPTYLILRQLA